MRDVLDMPGGVLFVAAGAARVRLRRYQRDDEKRFEPRQDFAAALAAEGGLLPPGPKWTLETGLDDVRGVGGLEDLGGGRFAAWACLAPLGRREWGALMMFSHRVFGWSRRNLGVRTLTAIPAPTPQAVRLMKRIGFVDVGAPWMIWEG